MESKQAEDFVFAAPRDRELGSCRELPLLPRLTRPGRGIKYSLLWTDSQ